MAMDLLLLFLFICAVMASFIITGGVVWLVCFVFEIKFSWLGVLTIWLLLILIK
jgi:hypothetical protein